MNGTNQQAKAINLDLTLDEVNVVLAGLGELPAKTSLSVIDKIRSQAVSQIQPQPMADEMPAAEGELVN